MKGHSFGSLGTLPTVLVEHVMIIPLIVIEKGNCSARILSYNDVRGKTQSVFCGKHGKGVMFYLGKTENLLKNEFRKLEI